MVRIVVAACFALLLALPAMAQEDYPRIQTSLGYANLSLPDFGTRHSGFANETTLNLTRTLGINNYMGIYGLGSVAPRATMFANFTGGKATWRTERVSPYGLAGIGFSYLTDQATFGTSGMAARFGGGADVPMGELMGLKFEYSRMTFRWAGNWFAGNNISAGVVFTLAQ
jgi:hypothetical protein